MPEIHTITTAEEIGASRPVVALRVGGQLFGLAVKEVRDVLRAAGVTPVPLAPPVAAGLINLRGRILPVIDLRARMGMEPRPATLQGMLVVVEQGQERIALQVDSIVDVMQLAEDEAENVPATMGEPWRELATGLYTVGKELMLILNVPRVVALAA